VLTVVTAGCIFSYVAWPRFVSKETMRTVWEALEFVGNTIIFILAGLLFGHKCLSRTPVLHGADVGWLILLFIVATLVRGVVVGVLLPFLNMMGSGLTKEEAAVMVWSGLRGAVGLILAMSLDLEPSISREVGSLMVFFVGGIAMMTICINGTTAGPLLRWLEMTKTPEIEDQTAAHLAKLTDKYAEEALDEIVKSDDPRFQGMNMSVVKSLVPSLSHQASKSADRALLTGVDVASRLRMYREIFMRSVQRHYWTDIEQGMIPKNSRIARILLYSTERALSFSRQSFDDWDTILENIDQNFKPLQKLCNQWPLKNLPALQQWFPSAHTVDMWKVYAALSFMEAHGAAQAQVPSYFDGDSVLGSRVQEQVSRESAVQCEKAAATLRSVPEELVELGKSRMLAGKMLQLQSEKLHALHEDGILHERGFSDLVHHVHVVQREVVGKAFSGKDGEEATQSEESEKH